MCWVTETLAKVNMFRFELKDADLTCQEVFITLNFAMSKKKILNLNGKLVNSLSIVTLQNSISSNNQQTWSHKKRWNKFSFQSIGHSHEHRERERTSLASVIDVTIYHIFDRKLSWRVQFLRILCLTIEF